MLLKLSGYVTFLIVLFYLPEQFFFYLPQKILEINKKIKALIPFHSVVSIGNNLLLLLSELEGSLSSGRLAHKINLPKFKFYTDLLLRLLEAHRQEGISLRKFIPELRLGVQRDIQFEKKVSKEIMGGNFQFLIISFTTWAFVFFSKELIEIKIDVNIISLMVILQILGFVLFNLLSSWLKSRQFAVFSRAFQEIYLFNALVEVRLPIKVILNESGIMNGALVTAKMFQHQSKRILYSVERWKTTGVSPKEESEELIKDLWCSLEEGFQDFLKKLQIIKFLLMALLFLPAYFLYLASIFKFFMEQ